MTTATPTPEDGTAAPAVGIPLDRRVRALAPKVSGRHADMTPLERLESDFRRMAAEKRAAHAATGHGKWDGMACAYTAAAEKVRALRSNAELSGPGRRR